MRIHALLRILKQLTIVEWPMSSNGTVMESFP
jgi:hypothetical protein